MQFVDLVEKPKQAFEKNNIAIALSSSDQYVPYLSVVLESILYHAREDINYDIIILNKDITDMNKQILTNQCVRDNVLIRFYNVLEIVGDNKFYCGNVAVESYFRVFLMDILEDYEKVVFLDCDIIVSRDIKELYDTEIEDYYFAAVQDLNIIGCYHVKNHWKPYLEDVLQLENAYEYIQAGVLVMNLSKLRLEIGLEYMVDTCTSYEWKLLDQDVLNKLCQGKIKLLDTSWNVMTGEEGRGKHVLNNTPKEMAEAYKMARENPYIIHFCGNMKPWIFAEVEFSSYFWKHARTSPYYETILERKTKNDISRFVKENQKAATASVAAKPAVAKTTAQKPASLVQKPVVVEVKEVVKLKKQVVVFRVLTVYQLLNAINLKLTKLKNVEADLIVSSATDFSQFVESVRTLNIFRNIYISKDTPQDYFQWKQLGKESRETILKHPEEYLYLLDFQMDYTDYYLAVADPYNKLFYYYMIKEGLRPEIHIFEDGLSTYLVDFMKEAEADIWNHNLYKDYRFADNIKELLLYEPDFYVGSDKCDFQINAMAKINYQSSKTRKKYEMVFGKNKLPEEQYIFLEEPFAWDGVTATDMELIEAFAEMVGKENIRVKLHPRNGIDRFTGRGYKIFEATKVPWEMSMMSSDISSKILVTISSTSAMTAGLVFGKRFKAINLFDLMMVGSSVHVRDPKFREFYAKMENKYNQQNIQVLKPDTMENFKEALIFLRGNN